LFGEASAYPQEAGGVHRCNAESPQFSVFDRRSDDGDARECDGNVAETTSIAACGAPLYGMCVSLVPVSAMNNSIASCCALAVSAGGEFEPARLGFRDLDKFLAVFAATDGARSTHTECDQIGDRRKVSDRIIRNIPLKIRQHRDDAIIRRQAAV